MRKRKYRIKTHYINNPKWDNIMLMYVVQVKTWLGFWVSVKSFADEFDSGFAYQLAEELLEKLEEK